MKLKLRKKPIKIGSIHIRTDLWHFFFPSKSQIQPDGASSFSWDDKGNITKEAHVSFTFRNYIVRKWDKLVLGSAKKLAERLGVETKLASQLGAIALDATAGANNDFTSQASPRTLSHTCTGSNLLLWVGGGINNTASDVVSGITYNSVSMTRSTNGFTANSTQASAIYDYYLAGPATGANDIVMSWDGTNRGGSLASVSYTGCSQTGIPDSDASGGNPANSCVDFSISTTVVADNCWLIGHWISQTEDITVLSGTTERVAQHSPTAQFFILGDSNGTVATGSQSLGIDPGSSNCQRTGWVGSFAPAAAASGPANLKTYNTITKANWKTKQGISKANVKTKNTIE